MNLFLGAYVVISGPNADMKSVSDWCSKSGFYTIIKSDPKSNTFYITPQDDDYWQIFDSACPLNVHSLLDFNEYGEMIRRVQELHMCNCSVNNVCDIQSMMGIFGASCVQVDYGLMFIDHHIFDEC